MSSSDVQDFYLSCFFDLIIKYSTIEDPNDSVYKDKECFENSEQALALIALKLFKLNN